MNAIAERWVLIEDDLSFLEWRCATYIAILVDETGKGSVFSLVQRKVSNLNHDLR